MRDKAWQRERDRERNKKRVNPLLTAVYQLLAQHCNDLIDTFCTQKQPHVYPEF